MLLLEGVRYSYDGGVDAIRGISLSIADGEIVGIIGPNGAGKSTLIKIMGGLLEPQSGNAILDKRPMWEIRAKERAREVAFVPQGYNMPFAFSAMQIVLMGRAPHLSVFGFESKKDIEIARGEMTRTDCLEFASRDINQLSGGERQRVILARALAQEPRMLLLDEPTTFLDIRHQMDLHKILSDLNSERGTTIICAMHDINLAAAFCRRIVVMKSGCVVADGTPDEVITPPIIHDTFGTSVFVGRSDKTKTPFCIPFE